MDFGCEGCLTHSLGSGVGRGLEGCVDEVDCFEDEEKAELGFEIGSSGGGREV